MARRPVHEAWWFLGAYRQAWPEADMTEDLIAGFAATEVVRRLIGVAQLPLDSLGTERPTLLKQAARALGDAEWETLFLWD